MNVLLSLDGILSSESGEPNRAGVLLYYALNTNNRVAIITSRKKEDAEHWLFSHGIIGYDDLMSVEVHLEGEDLKKRQFTLSRSRAPIEMYVDSDPSMCAWVFEHHAVPTILLSHPSYIPVEFRPDAPQGVRKWSDIEAAITRVNVAKSKGAGQPKDLEFWQD
jgi:hypothetical protein